MPHRRRAAVATIVALAIAQTLAFSAPKDAPPEVVVDLRIEAQVEFRAEPLVVERVLPATATAIANPVFRLRATAYNSMVSQTDAQPFVTATGQRTRWGILAVSRDLLGADLPYGSLVRLRDLGSFHTGRGAGAYQSLLQDTLFVVEDTMHPRKTNQVDLWFAEHASAVAWGVRRVEVEVVRYGHHGPTLEPIVADGGFETFATWLAGR
jgi:3D (Asp-Asp-Asp) domain-containing protein